MVFWQTLCKKPRRGRACCSAEEKTKRKVGCVMKKILLVLTVLALTAPCWAAVSVSCTAVGGDVTVSYAVTGGDPNNIRAFGLQIDVNNGATIIIDEVNDVNDADYYIFPSSIVIDGDGNVTDYGKGVAAGGNGSSTMTLEMGSLYAAEDTAHPCEPPQSGVICTFSVSKECTVSIVNDTARGSGGVVMEDGEDYATLTGCVVGYFHCLSQSHGDWAQYDAMGRPDSWCGPKQCHGDADNADEQISRGVYTSVGFQDFMILAAGYNNPSYSGDPTVDTWIAADFDHAEEQVSRGVYTRVGFQDFMILAGYYNDDPATIPADCQ